MESRLIKQEMPAWPAKNEKKDFDESLLHQNPSCHIRTGCIIS